MLEKKKKNKKKKEKHKEEKFRSSNALALFITLFSPFLSTDDAAACLCWPNKSWQTENVRLNQTESTASSRPAPRATPTRILRQTICRSFWYKLLGTKRQTLRAFFCMAKVTEESQPAHRPKLAKNLYSFAYEKYTKKRPQEDDNGTFLAKTP